MKTVKGRKSRLRKKYFKTSEKDGAKDAKEAGRARAAGGGGPPDPGARGPQPLCEVGAAGRMASPRKTSRARMGSHRAAPERGRLPLEDPRLTGHARSPAQVRLKLEEALGMDGGSLKPQKALIAQIIDDVLNETGVLDWPAAGWPLAA